MAGGLPNVHITIWALLIKIVHKEGGGPKMFKNQYALHTLHMVYEWPQVLNKKWYLLHKSAKFKSRKSHKIKFYYIKMTTMALT